MEAANRRKITRRSEPPSSPTVVGDSLRDVPTLPARKSEPPGQIVILLVHDEVLVQVLAVDGDGLQRRPAYHGRGAVECKDLTCLIELAEILRALSARHHASLPGQEKPCAIAQPGASR